jgi:hypothetical protein
MFLIASLAINDHILKKKQEYNKAVLGMMRKVEYNTDPGFIESPTIDKFAAITALFFIIFGTFGNLVTFSICLSSNLRKKTFFVFIAFITICDIFTLYTWNLSTFLTPFYHIFHENLHFAWCKFTVFCQYFSLQASAWLLVNKNNF